MSNQPEKNPQNNNVRFELLRMSPEFTNSILVSYGDKCVIFDAWGRADDWEHLLRQRGLKLRAIYTTHGHPDHISAAPDLVLKTGAQWFLHPDDFGLLGWGDDLLHQFGLPPLTRNVAPCPISAPRIEIFPNLFCDIIPCPGHTPGGVAFYFADFGICIIGDTLFADSVGRTDLPGGDINKLKETLSKLYDMNLPLNTIFVPGHGGTTNVTKLKEHNSWFKHW